MRGRQVCGYWCGILLQLHAANAPVVPSPLLQHRRAVLVVLLGRSRWWGRVLALLVLQGPTLALAFPHACLAVQGIVQARHLLTVLLALRARIRPAPDRRPARFVLQDMHQQPVLLQHAPFVNRPHLLLAVVLRCALYVSLGNLVWPLEALNAGNALPTTIL